MAELVCSTCGRSFNRVQALRGHERLSHKIGTAPVRYSKDQVSDTLKGIETALKAVAESRGGVALPGLDEMRTQLQGVQQGMASMSTASAGQLGDLSNQVARLDHIVANDMQHKLADLADGLRKLSSVKRDAEKVASTDWGSLLLLALGGYFVLQFMRTPKETQVGSGSSGPLLPDNLGVLRRLTTKQGNARWSFASARTRSSAPAGQDRALTAGRPGCQPERARRPSGAGDLVSLAPRETKRKKWGAVVSSSPIR